MMEPDKHELLARLASIYASFLQLLNQISEEQVSIPDVIGIWSVKDTLAHIIAHLHRAYLEVSAGKAQEVYPINHDCNDEFNAGAVILSQFLSYEQLKTIWQQARQQVVTLIES